MTTWCAGVPTKTGGHRHRQAAFSSISIGHDQTCGIRTSGAIACWGEGYRDVKIFASKGRFNSVAVGGRHICGITQDDMAICWGNNKSGQSSPPGGQFHHDLGPAPVRTGAPSTSQPQQSETGTQTPSPAMPPANATFTALSLSVWHSCALAHDGRAYCWGDNEYGKASPPANEKFSAISVDQGYGCGLRKSDGIAVCWGYDGDDRTSPPQKPAVHRHRCRGMARMCAPSRRNCPVLGRRPA